MILENIFRFFYPSYCNSCNTLIEQNKVFCATCLKKIKLLVSVYAKINKNKTIKVFSVSEYKDPLRSLVLKKTFGQTIASKQLAQLILEYTPIKDLDIDYIVPVPLHWTRFIKRGYNQSYLMSKYLSKNLGIPVLNVLKRKRKTVFQAKLSFEKRQENVKNAFDLKFVYKMKSKSFLKDKLKDKNILFVDDLYTTGATLKNAARVFNNFEIKSFTAAVACRVV